MDNCYGEWEAKTAKLTYNPSTMSFSSSMKRSMSTSVKRRKTIFKEYNFNKINCDIGILDIPTKSKLTIINNYNHYIHSDWNEFSYNSSLICQCDELYIRITTTYAQLISTILSDASDAIFIYVAFYPTIKKRRVYIQVHQPSILSMSSSISSSSLLIDHNNKSIISTTTTTTTTTNVLYGNDDIDDIFTGSISFILFGSIFFCLCILLVFIKKRYCDSKLRGVSLQITRHPITSIKNNEFDAISQEDGVSIIHSYSY